MAVCSAQKKRRERRRGRRALSAGAALVASDQCWPEIERIDMAESEWWDGGDRRRTERVELGAFDM